MPSPIAIMKMETAAGPVEVPIYDVSEVSYPAFRIETPAGVGALNLIDPDVSTALRVNTPTGVKGVNLVVAQDTGIVDYSTYTRTNPSNVIEIYAGPDYIQLDTPNNGAGARFELTADLDTSKTYFVQARIEQLQAVDDRVTLHIRNMTQSKYIQTSVATTDFLLNEEQVISGTFSPSSGNYTVGDDVRLEVVHSWRNSTHDDPMEFRIFSADLSVQEV